MISIGEANEVAEVLRSYSLRPPKKVINQRSVLRLMDDETQLILKALKTGAMRSFLIGKLLKKADQCPLIPKVLTTVSNQTYLWRKGNRYCLTQWIEGREADYFRIKDLEAAIHGMAMFHSFSKGVIRESANWKFLHFYPEQAWKRALKELITCRQLAITHGSKWGKRYLRLWHLFYEQACQAVEEYSSYCASDSFCLCYHDWAYHNLIIKEDQAYLVDFDYMLIDHAAHDKANLISRYLRLYQWDSRYLLKILWYFDKHYPWKTRELHLLRVYLTFPYDFWMIGRQYFIEKLPWNCKYAEAQWHNKIGACQNRLKTLEILKSLE